MCIIIFLVLARSISVLYKSWSISVFVVFGLFVVVVMARRGGGGMAAWRLFLGYILSQVIRALFSRA